MNIECERERENERERERERGGKIGCQTDKADWQRYIDRVRWREIEKYSSGEKEM